MPKHTSPPLIELDHVSKMYGQYESEVVALDAVSLKVFPGDFISIVGTSGCGKSTLLHIMGLLDRATAGRVLVEGRDTSEISGKDISTFRGTKMGFVFQNYNLIPRLTVLENVILPGLIKGSEPEKLRKRAEELLQDVGIEHRTDHKGVHLSGGEQQRVAIARALINDPVVILADEPTGALDSKSSTEIMKILTTTNKEKKVTIVFVSHDPNIASYGKRTVLLEDGRITDDTRENRVKRVIKEASELSKERWGVK
jgi:putative ABC transport system ATP-binding protein